jgi:hypothetical protein
MILDPSDYNGMENVNNNEYDYLEIGTCDWDIMSMTKPKLKGIIVEPISCYINNIPINKNVIKYQCAISTNNREDFMFYIPPSIIESQNIVNCFRGMNKLSDYHLGHTSNNLTNHVVKEKCKVLTYFTLLKELNVKYIDFLKIDTEGHDCDIINNILDELLLNTNYIMPKYILFENNGLTSIEKRTDTICRLHEHGYVHIFTEHDNTFMYNCKNYFERLLQINNISLPKDTNLLNIKNKHFFQNAHSYIKYGQKYLFENILKLTIENNENNSDVIWTTQSLTDIEHFSKLNKLMVNIIHGGHAVNPVISTLKNPNIVIKSIKEYLSYKDKCNLCFFIGKYVSLYNNFTKIYEDRSKKDNELFNSNNFCIQHGAFNYNPDAIKNTFEILRKQYKIDLYGFDSLQFNSSGWGETLTEDMSKNILTQYKFNLHLKGLGYLCNSVLFSMMSGIPTIMSKQNYYETLYYQFIPKELVILYDNLHAHLTNPQEIEIVLNECINMSFIDYTILCKKNYIHGTYFRKQYKNELEHLYHFMNKFQIN